MSNPAQTADAETPDATSQDTAAAAWKLRAEGITLPAVSSVRLCPLSSGSLRASPIVPRN